MNQDYRIDRYVAAKKRFLKSVGETEKFRREMIKAAKLIIGQNVTSPNMTQGQLNALNRLVQDERRVRMANRVLSRSLPRNLRNRIFNLV